MERGPRNLIKGWRSAWAAACRRARVACIFVEFVEKSYTIDVGGEAVRGRAEERERERERESEKERRVKKVSARFKRKRSLGEVAELKSRYPDSVVGVDKQGTSG